MSLILSGTDGLSDIDGSAATPAIRGTDANTGIFFPAADTIAFSEGGVEAMRIDSAGNVGIGTTSPDASFRVDIQAATAGARVKSSTGTNHVFLTLNNTGTDMYVGREGSAGGVLATGTSAYSGVVSVNGAYPLAFGTNGAERMRIDSSGNVQVGTTTRSNDEKLTVFQSGSAMGISVRTTGGPALGNYESADNSRASYWTFGRDNASTGNFVFANNGTQRAAIDTSGNLIIAKTASSSLSAVGCYNETTGSGANMVIASSGFMIRSTSSLKYKKNVQDATHGLADLLKLRSVTYESKNENEDGIVYGGLIAEEVDAAGLTEFVQYADDKTPDALSYGNMVSLCIKAIQEQQALITALTARITALETPAPTIGTQA